MRKTTMHMTRSVRRGLAVGLALLVGATALATDRVTLNDGSVVTGEIVRELNGSVWIKDAQGLTQFLAANNVLRIERDIDEAESIEPEMGETTPAQPTLMPAEAPKEPKRSVSSNAPRAAVLTFGEGSAKGMVGIFINAEILERCIQYLEEEDIDIVVLRVDSPGGYTYSVKGITKVLHEQYKPRFRTVTWIDWAISAAAKSSYVINEQYFTRRGAFGGATSWFGAYQAVGGRGLEDIIYASEQLSEMGGHDPRIIRSTMLMEPLSIDVDENGRVSNIYQNTGGEILINRPERVLTMTSDQAMQLGFAKGVADTLDELAKAMGLTEVEWVGKKVEGVPWPVCKAEEHMMEFREQTARDQARMNEYYGGYQAAVNMARGEGDRDRRGVFVSFARRQLSSIVRMVDNNPAIALWILNFNDDPEAEFREWVREQETMLRDLMR
jgi:hypothetical protein